ncbi:hypothetical protein HDU82_002602 [Entophlyctis luteolus]|nr:hypothetical protein HDU82_002602 [Entophlyctis luteolus]
MSAVAVSDGYPILTMPGLNALNDPHAKKSLLVHTSSLDSVDCSDGLEIKKPDNLEDDLHSCDSKHTLSTSNRDLSLSITLLEAGSPQRKGLGAMPERLRQNLDILRTTSCDSGSHLASGTTTTTVTTTTRESLKSSGSGSSSVSVYMNALQRNMERHAVAIKEGENALDECRPEAQADARMSVLRGAGRDAAPAIGAFVPGGEQTDGHGGWTGSVGVSVGGETLRNSTSNNTSTSTSTSNSNSNSNSNNNNSNRSSTHDGARMG